VINVVSREAGAGAPVRAGGELDSAGGARAFVHGQARGRAGALTLHASAADADGRTFEFPEFATTPSAGVADDADREQAHRIAARWRHGGLTVHGGFTRRRKDLPTAPYDTVFDPADNPATGDTVTHTIDRRGFVEASYERAIGRAAWAGRLAFDHQRYDGLYPYALEGEAPFLFADAGGGRWFTGEARVAIDLPGQRLTFGGEAVHHRIEQTFDEEHDGVDDLVDRRRYETGSAYLSDEIALGARLRITAGARFDIFGPEHDAALSPRLALVATPYDGGTTKLVLGRAFRAPSVYELHYTDGGITQRAPDALDPEFVATGELEHVHALGRRSYLLASLHASRIGGLVTLRAEPDGVLVFTNSDDPVTTFGGEVEARVTAAGGAWLGASLSATHLATDDREALVNAAPVVAALRGLWPVARELTLAGEAIYNAPRLLRASGSADADERTGHAVIADLWLTQRLAGEAMLLRVGVTNLLGWDWSIPVGEEFVPRAIGQAPRTFVVQLRYAP
jgi:outer membrane receptor protein involved in Fe transport